MLTTLYRPVGKNELKLIKQSGYKVFPPRLPEQPIFYPVLQEEYAIKIARDWNYKAKGFGAVCQFGVDADFLSAYPIQYAGGKTHQEHWIPAEDLEVFNQHIIGKIRVIHTFEKWVVYILQCSDPKQSLYCGITNDLEKRIATHNKGKGAKYTRGKTPVILLKSWDYASKSEALKEEYRIKQLTRKEKLALI